MACRVVKSRGCCQQTDVLCCQGSNFSARLFQLFERLLDLEELVYEYLELLVYLSLVSSRGVVFPRYTDQYFEGKSQNRSIVEEESHLR